MDTFTIRQATPEDVAKIEALEKVCFHVPWSTQNILYAVLDADTVFLVCEKDGAFVGYVSANCVCGEMYVGNLAVAPSLRRLGAGAGLMRSLIEKALVSACEFITLEVRESNLPARRLYESLGFGCVGIRPGFYTEPTENACIYTKYFNV